MQSSFAYGANMVDYRSNANLINNGVSFHFYNAGSTTMHYHNFYEFFVITHGKTRHELNGKVSDLSKNTLYMIRPEDRHQFTMLPGFDCVHMNLCVTEERLSKICDGLGVSIAELLSGESRSITLSLQDMSFFTERANQIGLMSRHAMQNVSVIAYELVAETVSQISKARLFSEFSCPEWFSDLLGKIHAPQYLTCTASDIYRLGRYSPPVMIHYFKTYTGKTIAEYLRSAKLDRACEMLTTTRLTSVEISSRLGYESVSHFTRIFKQRTGFSPGRYRSEKTRKPSSN